MPRPSPSSRSGSAAAVAEVFVNVPFDRGYEGLLVALVAGLATLGLEPRSVLEVPAHGADRLTRLKTLIRGCSYSVHDLSCRTARFNMPFELGLALGMHAQDHHWVVLDREAHSLSKALSDLDGWDVVQIHARSPSRLLACLVDAFHRPGVGLSDLKDVWRQLRKFNQHHGPPGWLFTRHGFGSLTFAAAEFAQKSRNQTAAGQRRRAR